MLNKNTIRVSLLTISYLKRRWIPFSVEYISMQVVGAAWALPAFSVGCLRSADG